MSFLYKNERLPRKRKLDVRIPTATDISRKNNNNKKREKKNRDTLLLKEKCINLPPKRKNKKHCYYEVRQMLKLKRIEGKGARDSGAYCRFLLR